VFRVLTGEPVEKIRNRHRAVTTFAISIPLDHEGSMIFACCGDREAFVFRKEKVKQMVDKNRSISQSRFTKLIAGIEKYVPGPVVLAATSYTQTALLQPFQSWLTAVGTLQTAKAQYHAAVVAEQGLFKTCQTLWLLLQAYARLNLDAATLAELGYAPVTHTAASPATKALAAAKAKATRAARHTLGKNQRKLVTGAPPGASATTTAASAPAVTAGVTGGSKPVTP
jgi:hypothetical protein